MKTYLSELIWVKREIKNRGPTLRLTSNALLGRITAPQRCHVLSLRTSEYVLHGNRKLLLSLALKTEAAATSRQAASRS